MRRLRSCNRTHRNRPNRCPFCERGRMKFRPSVAMEISIGGFEVRYRGPIFECQRCGWGYTNYLRIAAEHHAIESQTPFRASPDGRSWVDTREERVCLSETE